MERVMISTLTAEQLAAIRNRRTKIHGPVHPSLLKDIGTLMDHEREVIRAVVDLILIGKAGPPAFN